MEVKEKINIFSESCFEPFSDIIGYQLLNRNDSTNFRLYVRPNRFYVIANMAERKVDYDYYSKIILENSLNKLLSRDNPILFTGIKDPNGKWIKRTSYSSQLGYVKGYFLYEILLQEFKLALDITKPDIANSIGVHVDTLSLINWRLHQDRILYINTEDHKSSVKAHGNTPEANVPFIPYRYKTFTNAYWLDYCSDNNNNLTLSNQTLLKRYSNQIFFNPSATEIVPPLFLREGGRSPAIYEQNSEIQTPVVVIDYKLSDHIFDIIYGYTYKIPFELFISSYPSFSHISPSIYGNKDSEIEYENKGLYEDEEVTDFIMPDYIYVAPYEQLELMDLTVTSRDLIQNGWHDPLIIWERHHKNRARFTSCTRLYHPFHGLKREYRKYVCYNGSPLIEAMDVHNCFYTLLLKLLESFLENRQRECFTYPKILLCGTMLKIPKKEFDNYAKIVRNGTFYEDVLEKAYNYSSRQKEIILLTYNGEYVFDFLGEVDIPSRDDVKIELQSYRNIISDQVARYLHLEIDEYMINSFPCIRYFLFHYPTFDKKVTKKGKKKNKRVKRLQRDVCHLETYLMSKVCFELKSLGVTPFSLHDGIFVSEEEMEKLRKIWNEDSIKNVQQHIENIFWKHFDELTTEKVRSLIEKRFNKIE